MSSPPPLDPAPPRYSKRIWTGPVYGATRPTPDAPLTIYVEAIRSTFPEDWPSEREAWRARRAFMGRCYSVVEPEGEIGFTALSDVVEISAEEFRGAMAALRGRGLPTRRDG